MSKTDLTPQDIYTLSQLCAVDVSDNEAALFAGQFVQTLKHIENLNEIDIRDVAQSIHLSTKHNVMFEDGAANDRLLSVTEATHNAPHVQDGSFVVDKMM